MNFDQTWEKYENGFGDFQGKKHKRTLESSASAVIHKAGKF